MKEETDKTAWMTKKGNGTTNMKHFPIWSQSSLVSLSVYSSDIIKLGNLNYHSNFHGTMKILNETVHWRVEFGKHISYVHVEKAV